MVRTLRITSLVSLAAACAVVLFVLVFGFKPNAEIKAYLSQTSIVEQLKKKTGTVAQKEDKVSPLVVQAKLFKDRIDPPPPPSPPPPPPPKPSEEIKKVIQSADEVVAPKTKTAKFELAGTASYAGHPEKSLALLNLVSEGYKWFRQGDKIGQHTIHEIKNGSIVLYQNGKKDTELFVPKPQGSLKSLLKSDLSASVSIQKPSSVMTTLTIKPEAADLSMAQPESPEMAVAPGEETAIAPGINKASSQEPRSNVRIRRGAGASVPPSPAALTRPPVQPEPVLTVEQQRQSLEESIAGIKDIMNSSTEGMSEAEIQEQQKSWKELLDLLEKEKQNLMQNTAEKPQDSAKPQDASENKETKESVPQQNEE